MFEMSIPIKEKLGYGNSVWLWPSQIINTINLSISIVHDNVGLFHFQFTFLSRKNILERRIHLWIRDHCWLQYGLSNVA